ncbi:molybdopterin molybdotransferase MoeA [Bartonella sp. HY329]|uniref:molybdopterin molybdotransferase MoeA n=1 Tax=unclassified Bartonella TaxID=2645622 RepID=UPI0021C5EE86|nr:MULTISPECIES: gephyrin-like molybdotransferase Glp [unclassified Bartonella]UXM94001.1 molybdopterin molybdotransferase MoeA [Bartonella sp. HY329]UXN08323.1 molybdopterin molybdotransferase MoeA [Bartonella sp. HY328]
MALMTVDEALHRLTEKATLLESETIDISFAGGRFLSEPLLAKLTQPPFNSSAMDGYAVKSDEEIAAGTRFKVVGEAAAGHIFKGKVNKGESIRIFTGAAVPEDVNSVIIQENINKLDDGFIELTQNSAAHANIRPAGGDFTKGDVILPAATQLTPSAIGLAAASGHATVSVIRSPRIAILSTGDELVPAGTIPGEGQIVASNGYALAQLAMDHGGEVIDLGIVADNRSQIHSAIQAAKQQKADILITSGGVSVGDYDLVQEVMQEAGMELDFWKIALRPGKPLMFGTIKNGEHNMLVLGLPGNPVSAIVTATLFLLPMMDKMRGNQSAQRIMNAKLTKALKANGPRRHYIRGTMKSDEQGILHVTPAASADSSLMKIMAQSNCLIINEIDAPALNIGDTVKILIL